MFGFIFFFVLLVFTYSWIKDFETIEEKPEPKKEKPARGIPEGFFHIPLNQYSMDRNSEFLVYDKEKDEVLIQVFRECLEYPYYVRQDGSIDNPGKGFKDYVYDDRYEWVGQL